MMVPPSTFAMSTVAVMVRSGAAVRALRCAAPADRSAVCWLIRQESVQYMGFCTEASAKLSETIYPICNCAMSQDKNNGICLEIGQSGLIKPLARSAGSRRPRNPRLKRPQSILRLIHV
jgi:hypothetical protein